MSSGYPDWTLGAYIKSKVIVSDIERGYITVQRGEVLSLPEALGGLVFDTFYLARNFVSRRWVPTEDIVYADRTTSGSIYFSVPVKRDYTILDVIAASLYFRVENLSSTSSQSGTVVDCTVKLVDEDPATGDLVTIWSISITHNATLSPSETIYVRLTDSAPSLYPDGYTIPKGHKMRIEVLLAKLLLDVKTTLISPTQDNASLILIPVDVSDLLPV